MNIDPATEAILKLLLGEGKEFERMDPVLQQRLLRAIELMLFVGQLSELRTRGAFNLKYFDGHWQINVDGEKRIWIEEVDGELLMIYFGSTDHRHGEKR